MLSWHKRNPPATEIDFGQTSNFALLWGVVSENNQAQGDPWGQNDIYRTRLWHPIFFSIETGMGIFLYLKKSRNRSQNYLVLKLKIFPLDLFKQFWCWFGFRSPPQKKIVSEKVSEKFSTKKSCNWSSRKLLKKESWNRSYRKFVTEKSLRTSLDEDLVPKKSPNQSGSDFWVSWWDSHHTAPHLISRQNNKFRFF